MNERILKLKLEVSINKILYKKNMISKNLYEETNRKLNKMIFIENKNEI